MDTRLALLLLLFFSVNCSNDSTDDLFIDCRYSAPEQLFSKGLPEIENHQFLVDKMTSEEILHFKDGSKLRLIQSGCDYLKQEFEFSAPSFGNQKSTAYWLENTLSLLQKLSRLGPEYITYRQWAAAIKQKANLFELDKNIKLAEDSYVRINRANHRGDAILMLTLSEKP